MNKLFQTIAIKIKVALTFTCLLFFAFTSKAQYSINNEFATTSSCDTMTRGIFIIWWDNDFNYSAQASTMLDSLAAIRTTCLNDLNMQDPLNAQDGYYCNIYIHTPDNPLDTFFVNGWGNGVGGDANGYPFMTLPNFILGNELNLAHETFHIFQTHGMWDVTPGIYLTDDGGWFVETTAEWFAYKRYPNHEYAFITSEIIVRIPQVPLWLDWWNQPGNYPNNWQRTVRQYGLGTFLYYLTNVAGIPDTVLSATFYSGTNFTPQEYLYNQIGAVDWRNYFIDGAAHMTNNFDFIAPSKVTEAILEWETYADPLDDNKFIQTYTNTGSNGWFQPDDTLTTNAWSFNTYKLLNTNNETYTFQINGNATGSYGDDSYFQGKVLVQNSITGASFYDLVMNNDYQGTLSIELTPNDTAAYFIIGSMPEYFEDYNTSFQLFPYEMKISTGEITGLSEIELSSKRFEVARYNLLGQKVDKNEGGLQFIKYNDNTVRKIFAIQ